jgi:hypothetical protein
MNEVCGCGHPDCPECNPRGMLPRSSLRIPMPAGAATPRSAMDQPRALPHVIVVLEQRLSDGGLIHVERALSWQDLRNSSVRNYEISRMIEQVEVETQTRLRR